MWKNELFTLDIQVQSAEAYMQWQMKEFGFVNEALDFVVYTKYIYTHVWSLQKKKKKFNFC